MMEDRRLIVEIWGGPLAFRRAVLKPGDILRVGRTSLADLVIPHDDQMSQIHFEIRWDGARCTVRDAGSATGTLVDGQRVEHAEGSSGTWIRAGGTDFLIYFEQIGSSREDSAKSLTGTEGAQKFLGEVAGRGRLFALLDAARSERIVPMLQTAVDEYTSLYEGITAVTVAEAAPYLVHLKQNSRLLKSLVSAGWGNSWGIFVESASSLRELRGHFRRLLFVTREDNGASVYFRFYDPRILRTFLPLCTPRQGPMIFGPIYKFFVEDAEATVVLQFEHGPSGLLCKHIDTARMRDV